MKTEIEMLRRDGYVMLFAAVLFFVFILNRKLSILESVFFILIFIAYVFFLFEENDKYKGKLQFKEFIIYFLKFECIRSARQKLNCIRNDNANGENCQSREGFTKDILVLVLSCGAL